MLVMQEDRDAEHQENVSATGMVANSRPRDNTTKTTGRQTGAALRFSVHRALRVSARKSKATSDDEADPAHPHRYRPASDHDGPAHINPQRRNDISRAALVITRKHGANSGERLMPRYFFNIADGAWILEREGLSFSDLQPAETYARQLARTCRSSGPRPLSVIVTDEDGSE